MARHLRSVSRLLPKCWATCVSVRTVGTVAALGLSPIVVEPNPDRPSGSRSFGGLGYPVGQQVQEGVKLEVAVYHFRSFSVFRPAEMGYLPLLTTSYGKYFKSFTLAPNTEQTL